jgi:hypothetical protein
MERSDIPEKGGESRSVANGLLAALIALAILLSSITTVDRAAADDHEALFQRALVTFAIARTLNGLISAVQGTELALQPAGVGVTLTPGEVLDPVNDMIERFSWIMLGATLSLGVQQVLLDVGQWWGVRLVFAGLGLLWLMARWSKATVPFFGSRRTVKVLFRLFIIVLFIRFAVPLSMIANEALFELFLESRYAESTQVIESAGSDLRQSNIGEVTGGEADTEPGLFESLGQAFENTRQAMEFKQRVAEIGERATEVIEHLIQLSVVFILQTGILPIAFLWIFLQLFKQLFRQE